MLYLNIFILDITLLNAVDLTLTNVVFELCFGAVFD